MKFTRPFCLELAILSLSTWLRKGKDQRLERHRRSNVEKVSTHLTIDDGAHFLELLEEIVIGDVLGQISNKAARCLTEMSLSLHVSSSEWLVAVRRLIDDCSRIAHCDHRGARTL